MSPATLSYHSRWLSAFDRSGEGRREGADCRLALTRTEKGEWEIPVELELMLADSYRSCHTVRSREKGGIRRKEEGGWMNG